MKRRIVILPAVMIIFILISFKWNNPDLAADFLNSLTADQLINTQFDFNDQTRDTWHYLPSTSWKRPGVLLGDLNEKQKQLFQKLLRQFLSQSGYDKTQKIIELENILAELENNPVFRDPDKYHIAFYGDPQKDETWSWSFEGHHISLNFTIVHDQISMTPRFFGANPATIPSGERRGERTLSREEDLGLELINSLSPELKEMAVFRANAFPEIITENESQVDPLEPVGVRMNDIPQPQQDLLFTLIQEYLSSMPVDLAEKRRNKLREEEFGEIRFGWAGATELGRPHYYRVQGKTFLIEFDNTQNNANHIHTVWRDFDGDFGRDLLREHYSEHKH